MCTYPDQQGESTGVLAQQGLRVIGIEKEGQAGGASRHACMFANVFGGSKDQNEFEFGMFALSYRAAIGHASLLVQLRGFATLEKRDLVKQERFQRRFARADDERARVGVKLGEGVQSSDTFDLAVFYFDGRTRQAVLHDEIDLLCALSPPAYVEVLFECPLQKAGAYCALDEMAATVGVGQREFSIASVLWRIALVLTL